jgi:hypothetical protein
VGQASFNGREAHELAVDANYRLQLPSHTPEGERFLVAASKLAAVAATPPAHLGADVTNGVNVANISNAATVPTAANGMVVGMANGDSAVGNISLAGASFPLEAWILSNAPSSQPSALHRVANRWRILLLGLQSQVGQGTAQTAQNPECSLAPV